MSAGSFNLDHVFTAPGAYVVTVTATDPQGGQDVDTVPVTVTSPPVNSPPEVQAGSATATATTGVEFTRSGTATDSDGTVDALTVDYGDGGGPWS